MCTKQSWSVKYYTKESECQVHVYFCKWIKFHLIIFNLCIRVFENLDGVIHVSVWLPGYSQHRGIWLCKDGKNTMFTNSHQSNMFAYVQSLLIKLLILHNFYPYQCNFKCTLKLLVIETFIFCKHISLQTFR